MIRDLSLAWVPPVCKVQSAEAAVPPLGYGYWLSTIGYSRSAV